MIQQLHKQEKEALKEIQSAKDINQLKEIEVKYIGRKGIITAFLHKLKDLTEEEKKTIGPASNQIKKNLDSNFEQKRNQLEHKQLEEQLKTSFFDITLQGTEFNTGSIHPISQTLNEVEEIFKNMGFSIMDGPEIESEYYNFESLNVPKDHPARDMQDTFFIKDKYDEKQGKLVLRTQTSPVQIRTMQKYGAPLRVIAPGRTFRNEATDASHEHTFHQVEGLLIDKEISLAHLKGIMIEFLSQLFDKEVKIRLRPGYFPFVEPGLELDFACLVCKEKGCPVCKHTGWVEFMGAGMVHPNVLKAGGIKSHQGWAFGFGVERLVMMRYNIEDIRHFYSGNIKFLQQF